MLAGTLKDREPLKAIAYGKAGVALSLQLGWDKGTAGCLLNTSASFTAAAKLDSALVYIDSAIVYSYKAGDPNRLALAYLNRADIHMNLQNLSQSLIDCDSSLRYAEKANSDDRRARVFQTIGSVYFYQRDYGQSATYYKRASDLYSKAGNRFMMAIVYNNEGNVYKHQEQYAKAIDVFTRAIAIGKEINDLNNLSMYHENLSDVYLQQNNLPLAEQHAKEAMQYAVLQQNNLQLANAWECQGRIYLQQKKYDKAIHAGQMAYRIGAAEQLINVEHEATDLLATAYEKQGNTAKAFEFLQINKAIGDSMLHMQFDEDIAAMQTRFKVQEKDKEIALLANEKLLQEQKLNQQRIAMFTTIAFVLLLLLGVGLLINRYRLRQQMHELMLRNRIAADLHDEVGSSLSSIHMLSRMAAQQAATGNTPTEILGRVGTHAQETMDKMSDIVWMIKPGETEAANLKQRLEHFAFELCDSQNIKAEMQLDELDKWKLSMNERKNVYLISKEALNNAVKYAEATAIRAVAVTKAKSRSIEIIDNGRGFNLDETERGNGLDNMYNRATEMKGKLNIETSPGHGTTIQLILPE